MNVDHLRYIVMIDQVKSISRAASNLYITQPALSKIVRSVETETGLTIFKRSRNGVQTTYEGKIFIEKVKKVLDSFESLESEYFDTIVDDHENLSLFCGVHRSSPAVEALAIFCSRYGINSSEQNIVFKEQSIVEILQGVVSHELDFGLIHYMSSMEDHFRNQCETLNLHIEPLSQSPIFVQIRKQHPLSNCKTITAKMLEPYTRAVFTENDVISEALFPDLSSKLNRKSIHVTDRGTLRDIVSMTDSYYLGNDPGCHLIQCQDTIAIPLADYLEEVIRFVCITNADTKLSRFSLDYLDILKGLLV